MQDPVTTGWLWALGALGAVTLSVPIIRLVIAAVLYLAAVITGRAGLRVHAARALPRTAHLIGSLVVGAAAIAAPAMASARTAGVGIDRDGGIIRDAETPTRAVDRAAPSSTLGGSSATPVRATTPHVTLDRGADPVTRTARTTAPLVGHGTQPRAASRDSVRNAPSTEAHDADRIYIVRVGDTLWDIAKDHVPDARDANLTEAWKAIWRANRAVIGDDPGLIHPGQHLDLGGIV